MTIITPIIPLPLHEITTPYTPPNNLWSLDSISPSHFNELDSPTSQSPTLPSSCLHPHFDAVKCELGEQRIGALDARNLPSGLEKCVILDNRSGKEVGKRKTGLCVKPPNGVPGDMYPQEVHALLSFAQTMASECGHIQHIKAGTYNTFVSQKDNHSCLVHGRSVPKQLGHWMADVSLGVFQTKMKTRKENTNINFYDCLDLMAADILGDAPWMFICKGVPPTTRERRHRFSCMGRKDEIEPNFVICFKDGEETPLPDFSQVVLTIQKTETIARQFNDKPTRLELDDVVIVWQNGFSIVVSLEYAEKVFARDLKSLIPWLDMLAYHQKAINHKKKATHTK